ARCSTDDLCGRKVRIVDDEVRALCARQLEEAREEKGDRRLDVVEVEGVRLERGAGSFDAVPVCRSGAEDDIFALCGERAHDGEDRIDMSVSGECEKDELTQLSSPLSRRLLLQTSAKSGGQPSRAPESARIGDLCS